MIDSTAASLPPAGGRAFRHLIGNTLSLVTNDMVNRAITFVVYALIARFLGIYEFGQMSLTLTIFYLLQNLAPIGIKILVVRDVSKEKGKTWSYLIGGSMVAAFSSLLALGILYLFSQVLNYAKDTTTIIFLMSFGLIPYSISAVFEAILQAHEKIRLITFANVPISILRGVLSYLLLKQGFQLSWIAVIFSATFFATMLMEGILVWRSIPMEKGKVDFVFIRQIIQSSVAFLGLQTLIAVSGSLLPLIISVTNTEIQVGLFNAANQLMSPFLLVMQSIVMSLFPRLCQKHDLGADEFSTSTRRLVELLAAFAIPVSIGLFYFSQPVLILLYDKPDFIASVPVLQIMVWILITRSTTSVLGRVLMAANREKSLLKIMIIELIATVIISVIVIPIYQIAGAAITALVIGLLDLILHMNAVRSVIPWKNFSKVLINPLVASLTMMLWIEISKHIGGIYPGVAILLAMTIYLLAWLMLVVTENGSWLNIKKHYLGV